MLFIDTHILILDIFHKTESIMKWRSKNYGDSPLNDIILTKRREEVQRQKDEDEAAGKIPSININFFPKNHELSHLWFIHILHLVCSFISFISFIHS